MILIFICILIILVIVELGFIGVMNENFTELFKNIDHLEQSIKALLENYFKGE